MEKSLEVEALQICDFIDKLVRDIVVKNELKAKVLNFCCRAMSMLRIYEEDCLTNTAIKEANK